MPHKHTRLKGEENKSTFNLSPSEVAKPLPTSKSANTNGIFTTEVTALRKANKRKRKTNADDTNHVPQAFRRLMAFREGKRLPNGLDDGVNPTKKQKRNAAQVKEAAATKAVEATKPEIPKIRPGERMSEFSARVDAALPVSGLINKTVRGGGKDPLGLKVHRTKKEKKMHKLYDEWREQDRKIKEKKEEALELAEAKEEEAEEILGFKWKFDMEAEEVSKRTKKGGNKRKKMVGEVADPADDDDPWAVLKTKRGEVKVGLNEFVQQPPTFKAIPKEVFKVRGARANVENVPKTSGSLRKREELGEVRKSVVEGYRQLMQEKSSAKAGGH